MLHMMFAQKVRGPQVSRLFYDILFLNKGEAPLVSHGFPIEHVQQFEYEFASPSHF